jgi:polysaccharide biosynthesis transport protein
MEDQQPLNIDRALRFFRRRGIWIVVCMLLAGFAAFAISKSQEKKYTASAAVIFNESQLTQEIAGLPTTAANTLLQHASNLELVHLGSTAAKTAAKIGHGLTERDVEEAVSISGSTESSIVGISATDASAPLAAVIANTYARQFVDDQGSANAEYFQSALKLVQRQIAALSPGERNGTAGVDLFARAHSLALLAKLQPRTVEIVQRASLPAEPSSPTTAKNTVIGLVLGLFLGFGFALLLERTDSRIRDPHELALIYDAQLLGTVPRSARVAEYSADGPGQLSMDAEAFQVIRAQLGSCNREQKPDSILVSSASAGEGKSTIAFHLAGAAAQAGSRILLIEANFRRPSLARRLGLIEPFPCLLEATVDPEVIMNAARVSVGSYAGDGSLSVLPAGTLHTQSPAAVIDSSAMGRVLKAATNFYDLVVVDGPDLAGVSDAFLLMPKVDGVIVVGLNGSSRKAIAEDLMKRLRAGGMHVFGVVANCVGRGERGVGGRPAEARALDADVGDPTKVEGDPTSKAGVPT